METDAHATAALPMLLIRADTLEVTPDMRGDAARLLLDRLASPDCALPLAPRLEIAGVRMLRL